MRIKANIVDILNRRCFHGECVVADGHILSISEDGDPVPGEHYLMPGFVDAHVHIESSMLVPTEFARLAVCHGTVATVSDPHEIANVLGVEGVEYMLENARQTAFKCFFGVPSCVPATTFETAGDSIDAAATRQLLARDDLYYLAEMMNYPGVLFDDAEVMAKIAAAQDIGKPVDGHSPGLTGEDAIKYIQAGITTDHECVSYDEALHKLKHGMKIIIREGSAARNFEALHALISQYPDRVMLCSDDKHPDDLLVGHINALAARAVQKGHQWEDILLAGCINPVLHYGLSVGILRPGDPADMILVEDLRDFRVLRTYIRGVEVFDGTQSLLPRMPVEIRNRFDVSLLTIDRVGLKSNSTGNVRVIKAIDGSLLTEELQMTAETRDGGYQTDVSKDLLKILVVNRYKDADPAVAFIHGFSLKSGAIASSVAHDSHNIVAVGVDDVSLVQAVNLVIDAQGGVAAVDGKGNNKLLPLPVAGIMSTDDGQAVAKQYTEIDTFSKEILGSTLRAPFMTLSFMALLVIPQLKLSDKGLFDGRAFKFVSLEL